MVLDYLSKPVASYLIDSNDAPTLEFLALRTFACHYDVTMTSASVQKWIKWYSHTASAAKAGTGRARSSRFSWCSLAVTLEAPVHGSYVPRGDAVGA